MKPLRPCVIVVVAALALAFCGLAANAQEEEAIAPSKLAPSNVDFNLKDWGIKAVWRQNIVSRKQKRLRAIHFTGDYTVLELTDNMLYILSSESGALRGGTVMRRPLEHAPLDIADDNLLAVVSGMLYPIEVETGTVGNGWRMGVSAFTRPLLAGDDVVISCDAADRLAGARLSTKEPLWTNRCGGAIMNRPVLEGSNVYAAGLRGDALALDAASGVELWRWTPPAPAALSTGVEIAGEDVFAGDMQGTVYCLNKGNGAVRWRQLVELGLTGQPVAVDGKVLFLTTKSDLIAIDPAAEEKVAWKIKGVDHIVTTGTKRAYVMTEAGTLQAISVENGEVEWKDALGPKTIVVAAGNGAFLIGDEDGMVVAFEEPKD